MRRSVFTISTLGLVALWIAGCTSNEAKVRNMEQIYAEDGVPVKTETVMPGDYSEVLEYSADLMPLKESSANARIADKIDKVYGAVGDYVEKDAIVVTFPMDNPTANYYQAKVAFENAEATYRRMEDYYQTGGLSQQAYDNANAAFEMAKADWDAAEQSVKVKAPISGVITRLGVQETDNVDKEQELFAVSQIDRMKSRIWVAEKQIAAFKVGQSATAAWNGTTLKGKVVQVDMSASRTHQAFGVLIEFENPGMLVHGGVTADVRVETYAQSGAITIDRKNLVVEDGASFVYVVKDGKAQKRKVDLRDSGGLDVVVVDGLAVGDELVVEGQLHLADGLKVNVVNGNHADDDMVQQQGA